MARARRVLLAAAIVAASVLGAGHAAEPPVVVVIGPGASSADIARAVEAAQRGTTTSPAASAEATPKPDAVADPVDGVLAAFALGLSAMITGLASVPAAVAEIAAAWETPSNAATSLGAAARIAAVLAAAGSAALVIRRLGRGLVGRFDPSMAAVFSQRVKAAFLIGLTDVIATAAFAGLAFALREAWLPSNDMARALATGLATFVTLAAAYTLVANALLAPGRPDWRLLRIDRADRLFRLVVIYGVLGGSAIAAADVLRDATTQSAAVIAWAGWIGTAITLYKAWWFLDIRRDVAALIRSGATSPGWGRRLAAHAMPVLLITVALLIWAVGRVAAGNADTTQWVAAAGATQILAVLLPILATGFHYGLVEIGVSGGNTPIARAVVAAGCTLMAGLFWIGGGVLLAGLWGLDVRHPASAAAEALRLLVAVLAVLIAGGAVVAGLRAMFDAHAPRAPSTMPGEEDEADEGAPLGRLASILPIVRGLVIGTIVGLTLLVALSMVGVNIAPLLAGAGVLGLAVSFGSQALVRDVVSGIFFIADDAFRVGEYVDTGRLKGTVEKLSLRSVRLRHQSGQLHTIPYGQLQSVTNCSRDWATVKFNLRMDRGIDLERARRAIKRVGQDMVADPALAAEIILPLKLQGVAEITDSALVLRLKITAKPARASWVQREALKRVYAALNVAGIAFATNVVTVVAQSSDTARDDDAMLLAGANAAGATVAAVPGSD